MILEAPSFSTSHDSESRERFQWPPTDRAHRHPGRVSRSTVSRASTTIPACSRRSAERVQDVIREQNYAPKAAARSLASRALTPSAC